MKAPRALALLGLWMLFGSCSDDKQAASTLTLQITASPDIFMRMDQVKVRARRKGAWKDELYDRNTLASGPLEVVLFPPASDNDAPGSIEIAVSALKNGMRLVEERAEVALEPLGERGPMKILLQGCGATALCQVSDEDCASGTCLSCLGGKCDPRPTYPLGTPFPEPVEMRDSGAADAGRDATVDASDADAGPDAELDASPDSGDADVDAGPDAGPDAEPDVPPIPMPDPIEDAGPDASDAEADANDGYVPPPPPNPCDNPISWSNVEADMTIAPGSEPQHTVPIEGPTRTQYVCRVAEGSDRYPGKVNGKNDGSDTYLDGCWYAREQAGVWTPYPAGTQYQRFEAMISVKPQCLTWSSAPLANPALALPTGVEGGATVYSCRINVDNTKSKGWHIGRWSGVAGEPCHAQYFNGVATSAAFEVLARTQ